MEQEIVLTIKFDQSVIDRAKDTAEQAVECGLLSEEEAVRAAVDAIVVDGVRIS